MSDDNDKRPVIPLAQERMLVKFVQAPHPSTIASQELLDQCSLRTQRRSGPGGQHRNKVSSGAFLTHEPSSITAEATERRSQSQNRDVAFERLRMQLAIELRTPSELDETPHVIEIEFRNQFKGRPLKINDSNYAKAAVIALLLNDLHAAGGQPSAVSELWRVSTSSVIALIKSQPAAFSLLNQFRNHHGRRGLK